METEDKSQSTTEQRFDSKMPAKTTNFWRHDTLLVLMMGHCRVVPSQQEHATKAFMSPFSNNSPKLETHDDATNVWGTF